MANNINPVVPVSLAQPVNLNKLKHLTTEFTGFENCNSPFVNNALSAIYTKTYPGGTVDKNDNIYEIIDGTVKANGKVIGTVENKRFEATEIPIEGTLLDFKSSNGVDFVSIISDTSTFIRYKVGDIDTTITLTSSYRAGSVAYYNNKFYIFLLDSTRLSYAYFNADGSLATFKYISIPYIGESSRVISLVKDNSLLVQVWDVSGEITNVDSGPDLPIYKMVNDNLVTCTVVNPAESNVSFPRLLHPDGNLYNHTPSNDFYQSFDIPVQNITFLGGLLTQTGTADIDVWEDEDDARAAAQKVLNDKNSEANLYVPAIPSKAMESYLYSTFVVDNLSIRTTPFNKVRLDQGNRVTINIVDKGFVYPSQQGIITRSRTKVKASNFGTRERLIVRVTPTIFSISGRTFQENSRILKISVDGTISTSQPAVFVFRYVLNLTSIVGTVIYTGSPETTEIFFSNTDLNLYKQPGLQYTNEKNYYGRGLLQSRNNWNTTFNNGFANAVSYSKGDLRGTLVSEIATVDGTFDIQKEPNYCVYKTEINKKDYVYIINIKDGADMTILFDRYLKVNTTDFYNLYDQSSNTWIHAFDDWNDRIIIANKVVNGNLSNSPVEVQTIGSGVNVFYPTSGSIAPSTYFNFSVLTLLNSWSAGVIHVQKGNNRSGSIANEYITICNSAGSSGCAYWRSYNNGSLVSESRFAGLQYPTMTSGVYLSSNILDRYITSYTGLDLALTPSDTLYSLFTFDGGAKYLLGYLNTSQITGVEDPFVIQGTAYLIKDDRIFRADYVNGQLIQSLPIVDIVGLEFVANTTQVAYFFSKKDRSLYIFAGDRTLTLLQSATAITDVYTSTYDIANDAVIIACNLGVLFTNKTSSFIIPTDSPVVEIIPTNNYLYLKSTAGLIRISYFPIETDVREKVKFETLYYGATGKQSIVDCIYLRLYTHKQGVFDGEVTCQIETITGVDYRSDQNVIKLTNKDFKSGVALVRYQPRFQQSAGVKLIVESDFDVYDLQFGLKQLAVSSQSKLNL